MVARVLGSLGTKDAPRQMRRLFGPRGGGVRHDALAATDVDKNSNGEASFAAWKVYRKERKNNEKTGEDTTVHLRKMQNIFSLDENEMVAFNRLMIIWHRSC